MVAPASKRDLNQSGCRLAMGLGRRMKQPIGKVTTARTTAQGVADTEAFIAYLDARSDVEGDKTGTVDFCMWGGMVIVAAGTWPDRFAALVSFHGGNLATEAADSPHVYSPKLKADCTLPRLRMMPPIRL